MTNAHAAVILSLKAALRYLAGSPAMLYSYKSTSRDRREPGREMKNETEQKLSVVFGRVFHRQAAQVREQLGREYPDRKAVPDIDFDDLSDDEEAELILILTDAVRKGVKLFGQRVGLEPDYTVVNTRAAEWARRYVGQLVKGISETTREALRQAIATFAETPGFTIGDIMKQLPFTAERALMVAVTETTRAYAQGNRLGAKQLQEQWPGVKVIRTWFTNNDDLVCPVCGQLNGAEVGADDPFKLADGTEVDDPPAHPNCRCWTDFRTRING